MNKTILVPVILASLPATLLAGAGWSGYAQVAELTPTIHHRYHVRLDSAENPSGCTDKQTFYQDYAATGSEHMFQTLLEAVTSGKQVRLYVTGKCELNGYAEFSAVGIVP